MFIVSGLQSFRDKISETFGITDNLTPVTPVKEKTVEDISSKHWTYYVFVAGTILGTIGAIAAFILKTYPLMAIGILLAGTNALAAFYVNHFAILHSLDDSSRDLTVKIKTLTQQVEELKEANASIKKINDDLTKIPAQLKAEVDNANKKITSQITQISKLTYDLKNAEEKIAKLAQVAQDLNTASGNLSQQLTTFGQENTAFGDRALKLAAELNNLKDTNSKLVLQITNIDVQTDEYQKLNQSFSAQIRTLSGLFKLMEDMYTQSKSELSQLHQEVIHLKMLTPQTENAASRIEEVEKKYEGVVKLLTDKINDLKKLKDAYIELQDLKNSDEWKQFQTWKTTQKQGSS